MKLLLLVTCILFAHATRSQDPWKDVYRESAWKERDTWQKPTELIAFLKIKTGSKVADIGCHEGYMTVKLAREVGAPGEVFAVDIDAPKLEKLRNHLRDRKISNVKLIRGEPDDPKLPSGALDAVILLDTYHEMDDHDEILQHIKTALKPGGRLVICEPISDNRRNLNRNQQEQKHELGMDFALADLQKAGFTIVLKRDPFVDRTSEKGDKMWVIVAEKK